MEEKLNKKVIIFSVIAIVIAALASSYAIFRVRRESGEQSVTSANFSISYSDGAAIIRNTNIDPMDFEDIKTEATTKSFTVQNTSNRSIFINLGFDEISMSDELRTEYFRYNLYETTTGTEVEIASGSISEQQATSIDMVRGLKFNASQTRTFKVYVWLEENYGDQNALQGLSFAAKLAATGMTKPKPTNIAYTGSINKYIIPEDGTYEIEIAGAEGTKGNVYSYTGTEEPTPGKGAKLKADFSLNRGDNLTLVVGGQGSITQATAKDGTSGAGGGGTFVFKEIPSITSSSYQFTKESTNYEVLLVAAGGGGTGDSSYKSAATNGYDGVGNTWYSPSNIVAFSTTTNAGNTSSSGVLGITQFIKYNSIGASYTRGVGKCVGGFGGGGCADDSQSYGGGWSGSSYKAYSFSSGSNTTGITGSQSGNGYFKITRKS